MRKSITISALILISMGLFSFASAQTGAQVVNEPLTLQTLNLLLRREVGRSMTEADLAIRVERLGIAFDPTPEAISRLRANGAHQNLINTVKRAAEKLSDAAGKVVATGPQATDSFLEEARKVVRDYL